MTTEIGQELENIILKQKCWHKLFLLLKISCRSTTFLFSLKNKLGEIAEHKEESKNTYATTKNLAYLTLQSLSFLCTYIHFLIKRDDAMNIA